MRCDESKAVRKLPQGAGTPQSALRAASSPFRGAKSVRSGFRCRREEPHQPLPPLKGEGDRKAVEGFPRGDTMEFKHYTGYNAELKDHSRRLRGREMRMKTHGISGGSRWYEVQMI